MCFPVQLSPRVRAFMTSRSGAVSVVFALSIIPLMALTGTAVDYANAVRSRSNVASIADAAVVGAVSETVVKPTIPWDQQKDAVQKAAETEFDSQVQGSAAASAIQRRDISVTVDGSIISVKICYYGQVKTSVMKIAGMASIDFSGCATAQSAPPVFVSVYALVDASGSMGIGATHADQTLMQNRLGCAFACHTVSDVYDDNCIKSPNGNLRNWWYQTPKCAKVIGAKTRFDIVREALIKVTDQAQTLVRVPNQYRISVHKFSNYLTEVTPGKTDLAQVKSSISVMMPDKLGAGSNFYKVLPEFAKNLPKSGDGKSADTPKVFALILTDGISSRVFEYDRCRNNPSLAPNCYFEGSWYYDSPYTLESPYVDGGIRSQAFNPKLCDDLKKKNITVMTLLTEFDSSNINDGHMKTVDSVLRARSIDGLKGCATATNLAYKANLGPDVDSAIRQMFTSVVEKARIVR